MKDLFTYLSETEKPIVLYGTGDGADKILNVLEARGASVSAIFASDGFVRKRTFRGIDVMSYTDVCRQLKNFIVLVAFGSNLKSVIDRVYAIAAIHETYIPDVPAYGEELFDSEFYLSHEDEIKKARQLFSDERSKLLYDSIIEYKLTGKPELLTKYISEPDEAYTDILHPKYYKNTFDLGAYNGDTALKLCEYVQPDCIINAVEPNVKLFNKLCFNTVNRPNINPILSAAWNERTILEFNIGRGRGAAVNKQRKTKTVEICADTLDNMANGNSVDYIKYDVEGTEKEALEGSRRTIKEFLPELCVSVYHKSRDIFALPIMLSEISGDYDFFLRRTLCIPAWEINLYAVKKSGH